MHLARVTQPDVLIGPGPNGPNCQHSCRLILTDYPQSDWACLFLCRFGPGSACGAGMDAQGRGDGGGKGRRGLAVQTVAALTGSPLPVAPHSAAEKPPAGRLNRRSRGSDAAGVAAARGAAAGGMSPARMGGAENGLPFGPQWAATAHGDSAGRGELLLWLAGNPGGGVRMLRGTTSPQETYGSSTVGEARRCRHAHAPPPRGGGAPHASHSVVGRGSNLLLPRRRGWKQLPPPHFLRSCYSKPLPPVSLQVQRHASGRWHAPRISAVGRRLLQRAPLTHAPPYRTGVLAEVMSTQKCQGGGQTGGRGDQAAHSWGGGRGRTLLVKLKHTLAIIDCCISQGAIVTPRVDR